MKAILIGGPHHGETIDTQEFWDRIHFMPQHLCVARDMNESIEDVVYFRCLTLRDIGIYTYSKEDHDPALQMELFLEALQRGLSAQAETPDMRWIIDKTAARYGLGYALHETEKTWFSEYLCEWWKAELKERKGRAT